VSDFMWKVRIWSLMYRKYNYMTEMQIDRSRQSG